MKNKWWLILIPVVITGAIFYWWKGSASPNNLADEEQAEVILTQLKEMSTFSGAGRFESQERSFGFELLRDGDNYQSVVEAPSGEHQFREIDGRQFYRPAGMDRWYFLKVKKTDPAFRAMQLPMEDWLAYLRENPDSFSLNPVEPCRSGKGECQKLEFSYQNQAVEIEYLMEIERPVSIGLSKDGENLTYTFTGMVADVNEPDSYTEYQIPTETSDEAVTELEKIYAPLF